jgi:uncharacterized protein (DUF2062 family)
VNVRAWLKRLYDRARDLWHRARSERASPREIGWAVFIGVFCGCTPAIGVRPIMAVGAATLFRKNRLFAYLSSHITSNWLAIPWVILIEVQLSHRLRFGDFVTLEMSRDVSDLVRQARGLLVDWVLGSMLFGTACAAFVALTAYGIASRRRQRRDAAAELTPPRTPAAPRQQSSESNP